MHEGVDLAIEVVSPAEEEQRWGGSYRVSERVQKEGMDKVMSSASE